MPKPPHPIWASFNMLDKTGNCGKWAQCKKCKKEMQGIPGRLSKHVEECSGSRPSPSTTSSSAPLPKKVRYTGPSTSASMQDKVVITGPAEAKKIDKDMARYFYATNTPFHHANHDTFKKLCTSLRPGYKPPTAFQIGGQLLEDTYNETLNTLKDQLDGKAVTMALDGWTNIKNDPIVCCSITTADGRSLLVDTVDTSGNPHTAEYLQDVACNAIKKTSETLGVKVTSFVTDNAANVTKMRVSLQSAENVEVIQYGCNAHMLNLLAQDLDIKSATQHIVKVVKYFRNKHQPSSWYKAANGKKLIVPIVVRWNTMRDCLKSYLDNRGILVQVCQNHNSDIDADIIRVVNDANITNNAMTMLARLGPIATALDRAQRDGTTIAVAVEIWRALEEDLKGEPSNIQASFQKRRDMALRGTHYLANILDHRFRGANLNSQQRDMAFSEVDEELMPLLTALMLKSAIFPQYLFSKQFQKTPPLDWWKLLDMNTTDVEWRDSQQKQKFMNLCEQLLTAVASTAGLERTFSTFGVVQSKLRNRLGNEKAHKLVSVFKSLNEKNKKKKGLEWVWDKEIAEQQAAATESEDDWDWDPEDEVALVDLCD